MKETFTFYKGENYVTIYGYFKELMLPLTVSLLIGPSKILHSIEHILNPNK